MAQDPYVPPRSGLDASSGTQDGKYGSYAEVPYYRKQWFFWLMYFTISPIAIAVLLFGDVYYQRKGRVKSFGMANRIVAGLIGIVILFNMLSAFSQ